MTISEESAVDGSASIDDGPDGGRDPWGDVVRSVGSRRSYAALFFKPVLLIGVVDLVDEGVLDPARMEPALVVGRFCETVGRLYPSRADQGWRPFWHLSNDRAWTFFERGRPVDRTVFGRAGKPNTPSQFYSRFTEVSVPVDRMDSWRDAHARRALRCAMIAMLDGGNAECRRFATLLSKDGADPELPPGVSEAFPQGSSQGFQPDADVRRAVERRAMDLARVWLEAERWSVQDVSAARSYDLHCTRGELEMFVEVKGSTGKGDEILLTGAEVEFARAHREAMALAVVSGIEVDQGPGQAKGGILQWRFGWAPEPRDLSAVSYICSLGGRRA